MQLDKLTDMAYTITKEHGFLPERDAKLTNLEYEDLMLKQVGCLHEEVTEAFQELRSAYPVTAVYYKMTECGNKPEGFPVELADLVIRVMSLAGFLGLPLEELILEKMEYNKKRPHLHGRAF